jgi:hypothetical protein
MRTPALSHFIALQRLLQEMTRSRKPEATWFRLGMEMAHVYHASAHGFPWRWYDLNSIKDLCAQAGVGLPTLVCLAESGFPPHFDHFYPEDLYAWYAIEAGLRSLVGSAVVSTPTTLSTIPANPNAGVLCQAGQTPPPSKKALALAVLIDHPDWSDKAIAQAIGVSRTTLYDWKAYKSAREMLKRARSEMPRDFIKRDGGLEAWDAKDD